MVQSGGSAELRGPRTSSQAPRTHARRCCLSCRTKKVRCHLQDPFVPSASTPLPTHLACSRCQRVGLDCIVDDQHLKRLLIRPRTITTTPGPPLDSNVGNSDAGTSSDHSRREAAVALSSFATGGEASPEQEGSRYQHKRRCLSAIENLSGGTSLPDAALLHARTFLNSGEEPASLRRAGDPPQPQSSGSTDTIRYLHRPLSALGELLSQDASFRQYIEDNYKVLSEPASAPYLGIHDYITRELCEELEPLLEPLLAFSPYIPPLRKVYASSKARVSLPSDLLLAVLCSLALRSSPANSHMARPLYGVIDRLGTAILLSLPAAAETAIALSLLLAYEPMALCSGLLRFGPLRGSAIIGETLLTAAVSAALTLGFDKVARLDASAPAAPQGSDVRALDLDLCDDAAKASLWWTLSAWQAHFALNRIPFKPHCLDQEGRSAASYARSTRNTSPPEVDVHRQQGRIYLAHRIMMLAEIFSATEQLDMICSRSPAPQASSNVEPRTITSSEIPQIRREAEALCQRTRMRLMELEEERDVAAVQYGHTAAVTFLEGWVSLEQSALHSLFLSKVAVAGVTGSTDFILPLPDFIETIRTNESTSIWLELPGRARREAAERAIGAFCGLEVGEEVDLNSRRGGKVRTTSSGLRDLQGSEDGRYPTDQLWAFAPILTTALLLDSCRALLEAEAFTRIVSRHQTPRRECLTVLVKQAAARLRKSCAVAPGRQRDTSGNISTKQPPINLCVAEMLEEMLVTLNQWHRHRSHQLARSSSRYSASMPLPRADANGGASAGAMNMPGSDMPSAFREQASAALPDLTLATAPVNDSHILPGRQSDLDTGLQWPTTDFPTDALWLDLLLSIGSSST